MQVTAIIPSEEGPIQFQGDLPPEEFNFIFTVGLATLLKQGALSQQFLSKVKQEPTSPIIV